MLKTIATIAHSSLVKARIGKIVWSEAEMPHASGKTMNVAARCFITSKAAEMSKVPIFVMCMAFWVIMLAVVGTVSSSSVRTVNMPLLLSIVVVMVVDSPATRIKVFLVYVEAVIVMLSVKDRCKLFCVYRLALAAQVSESSALTLCGVPPVV